MTVALSGDGGDELFAGYTRYKFASQLTSKLFMQPHCLRRIEAMILNTMPEKFWSYAEMLIPTQLRHNNLPEKVKKFSKLLNSNYDDVYLNLIRNNISSNILLSDDLKKSVQSPIYRNITPSEITNFVEKMMFLDTVNYLPDDILTKVDRASMASALEVRVPFLDLKLVKLAWIIPLSVRFNIYNNKPVLRSILSDYIPLSYFDRPKMGFGIPLDDWLRGPLKEWMCDMLSNESIKHTGYFNYNTTQMLLNKHLREESNYGAFYGAWHQFRLGNINNKISILLRKDVEDAF